MIYGVSKVTRMSSPTTSSDREKVVSKLPGRLRQSLKVRCAQHGLEIQTAIEQAVRAWTGLASGLEPVDTAGADSFSTFLPHGQWNDFKAVTKQRSVSLTQGLAQAVHMWLDSYPAPDIERPVVTRRFVVCNQKGGVGKTAITAGLGEAMAEDRNSLYPVQIAKQLASEPDGDEDPLGVENLPGIGLRVLLVDFDPQCHLTNQLGATPLPISQDGDSLTNHMGGSPKGDLRDLIVTIDEERFGDRLHLLPSCNDAFLLDVRLSGVRAREAALERALAPLEADYDVIVVDCPPSLGLSMDAAVYYGRRRKDEVPGQSGPLVVVQAEDSSADAYDLLTNQIEDLRNDMDLDIDYLGLVVNLYDPRRGYIATSSLEGWMDIKDPRVVAIVSERKEQKEAVRMKQPLLSYAPKSQIAISMRAMARELS